MKYSLVTYPLPLETQNGNKNSLGNKKNLHCEPVKNT